MPKIDGRQVLKEMRADSTLASIPVVVLTTSHEERDVVRCYKLGCNSFIHKPVEIHDFIEVVRQLGHYWFKLVVLPPHESADHEDANYE